ncbi:hypothetical protein STEG23_013106 [Scotinomys teguina]
MREQSINNSSVLSIAIDSLLAITLMSQVPRKLPYSLKSMTSSIISYHPSFKLFLLFIERKRKNVKIITSKPSVIPPKPDLQNKYVYCVYQA